MIVRQKNADKFYFGRMTEYFYLKKRKWDTSS